MGRKEVGQGSARLVPSSEPLQDDGNRVDGAQALDRDPVRRRAEGKALLPPSRARQHVLIPPRKILARGAAEARARWTTVDIAVEKPCRSGAQPCAQREAVDSLSRRIVTVSMTSPRRMRSTTSWPFTTWPKIV